MEEIETKEEITTIQEDSPRRIVKKTSAIIPPVQTEHPQKVFEKKKKIFQALDLDYIFRTKLYLDTMENSG